MVTSLEYSNTINSLVSASTHTLQPLALLTAVWTRPANLALLHIAGRCVQTQHFHVLYNVLKLIVMDSIGTMAL